MNVINLILNNVFYLSLLLILISSMIGMYLRMRARDRCLSDFEDFAVTVEMTSGVTAWGQLKVYGSGLELTYRAGHLDRDGHVEKSYIIYNSELSSMKSIRRYPDELTPENQKKRLKDLKRTYNPSVPRVLSRKMINFFNTFRDALTQTVALVIGSTITKGPAVEKKKDITGLGTKMLDTVSKAYDPILERYIGHYVVLESHDADGKHELVGIMNEYTPQFIEVLDVACPVSHSFEISPGNQLERHGLLLDVTQGLLQLENRSPNDVTLLKIANGSASLKPGQTVLPGQQIQWDIDPGSSQPITIDLKIIKKADLILPLTIYTVRHGGELSDLAKKQS